jgi:hypothetical protein
MEPSMPSDPLDQAIREAAPRAPRGFAAAVERRIAGERRARSRLVAVGALVAMAAGLVVWLLARSPSPRVVESTWTAVAAHDATVTVTQEGATVPLVAGRAVAVGAVIKVGAAGEARLERTTALGGESETRVGDGALELLSGSVRLEGPEARLTGDVAAVETLGVSADVAVELRRNPMWKMIPKAAALSALLAVTVQDGGARVEAKGHDAIVLAKNDRALVAPKLPPLTTRANAANASAAKKPPAATAPATAAATAPATAKKPAPAAAAPRADVVGALDKDTIRKVVVGTIGDIKACYDVALAENKHLAGRIVVKMTVVTKDGKGHVSEGEIVPNDDGDLNSAKMQQCILEVLSRAEFPPSADGEPVVIGYPFVFATGNDE